MENCRFFVRDLIPQLGIVCLVCGFIDLGSLLSLGPRIARKNSVFSGDCEPVVVGEDKWVKLGGSFHILVGVRKL